MLEATAYQSRPKKLDLFQLGTIALGAGAGVKIAVGLVAFSLGALGWLEHLGTRGGSWVYFAEIGAYTACGVFLIVGSARDRRAALLGVFFLLIASSFSGRPVDTLAFHLADRAPGLVLRFVSGFQADAFLPLYMWLFARSFPKADLFGLTARIVNSFVVISIGCGIALFAVNLLLLATPPYPVAWFRVFAARDPHYYYWIPTFTLTLAALGYMASRLRRADTKERLRARIFVASFVCGLSPMLLTVVASTMFPSFGQWILTHFAVVYGPQYLLLLAIPITAGYAVLVHQVLDVRFVVRRAIRYLLATWTIRIATVFPIVAFTLYGFVNRRASVSDVVSSFRGRLFLAAAAVGLVALTQRERWLTLIDRRFFRQQYDAHVVLSRVIERSRWSRTIGEWFALVGESIDRALHVERVALLIRNDQRRRYASIDGSVPPLMPDGALIRLLTADAAPLIVDLDNSRSPLHLLPLEERVWLADSAARLLIPMTGSDMGLVGVLIVGDKRSEQPFTADDREMLSTLGVSGGLLIENQLLRAASDRPPTGDSSTLHDEVGGECNKCGAVLPLDRMTCTCGATLIPSPLPLVLLGKFQLERKIGAGGMGIVYAATDLSLDRTVAIKTLPRVSPEHAARLRREARAMARVQHQHLALIFGVESWHGTPLLVVEYLEGGTLLDRIGAGSMSIPSVIAVGVAIASALESLHAVGLLHRDVKPSNIGFKKDGVPKLLDFGLARLAVESGRHFQRIEPDMQSSVSAPVTATSHLVGTPLYLSPEAIQGAALGAHSDLWALAMTLYHALAGRHPWRPEDGHEARPVPIPDLRTFRPTCPANVALLLSEALSADPARRPATAAAFRERLMI